MSTAKQTIAFFGATGGTACASLAHALRDGHKCTALVRTPEKLHTLLTEQHSIPTSTIDSLLTVHPGSISDTATVAKTLINPLNQSTLVDVIYFAIGTYPVFQASLTQPFVLPDPTICEHGMQSVFNAIESLAPKVNTTVSGSKPLVICISSTGVNGKTRDVPLPLKPLYHWLGSSPHADKRKMEQVVLADNGKHTRDFIVVRPTLLMDNEPKGLQSVRAGWEWGSEDGSEKSGAVAPGPQIGWSIGRKDVGEWIFRKAIVEGGWDGKCVSLTY